MATDTNQNITLLVMAGGLGSRFGGLKQVAGFGPNGESILEYSVYDAIRVGFTKVIFIVNAQVEEYFQEYFIHKISPFISADYVVQDLRKVPGNLPIAPERTKPLGTAHAVWSAKLKINVPFAVINGDDFYGLAAFQEIAGYLISQEPESNQFAMVGYQLKNTLSAFGTVARGICEVDENGYLTSVTERTNIEGSSENIFFRDEYNQKQFLSPGTLISMNLFGLMPSVFTYLEESLIPFIAANNQNLKAELYLPQVIDDLIIAHIAKVKVLKTEAKWFGVTYAADREEVVQKLAALIQLGEYPVHLWQPNQNI